ncbi:MAG: PAS domain S-box protein, partial [Planctomycetota bacterium]|nr:PAS domain S-box protein [Planctomycetota bacterium]
MYGGGMARLRNDTFTRYTTLEGLPDNSLGKILEDDAGNLWINSNRGVFRVSLDELNEFAEGQRSSVNCRTLGTGEGKGQSGARTSDGRLWFPTLDGLITIEPKLVTTNEVPPPIVIETVRVSDQLFDATDRIELPLGRRDVVIEYAGLSFVDPDNVTFRYRLVGYDENWVDTGAQRRAKYRHIPPGTYEFQVQARNNDYVWSAQAATIGITVPAHFYETRAFYVVCWLGVVLAGLVGLRARTRTMRIRNAALLESEAKYSDLYDNAPDMFCSVDAATGKVLECNLTLAAATGYSKNELIGRHISDLYHPDCEMDRQKVFKAFAQFGDVHDAELQLLRKDGGTIDVSLNVSAVRDEQGNVVHSRSIWRDITERRQAQAALEESEKRSRTELAELQHIYNAAPVGLCLMDTNLRYLRINQWLADINGISIENHIGRTLREIVPEIAESMEPVYRKVVDTGEPALDVLATGATPANPQDVRHFMASYYPLKSPAGVVLGLSSIVRDVTERKRAEEAIQEKEKQLDNLLSNVGVIVLEGDPFNIYYVGGQAERILGYRKEQWFEDPDGPVGFWSKHLHPDDEDKIELCRRAIESGKDHAIEYRMIASDGREVWFYDTVTVETENGRPVKTRSVMFDITERKLAEEELRGAHESLKRREQHFRGLLESSPDGMLIVNADGKIAMANTCVDKLFGYAREELIGQPVELLVPERYPEAHVGERTGYFKAPFVRGLGSSLDLVGRRKDGTEFPVEISLGPLETDDGLVAVGTIRDVTLRKRAEEALRASEIRSRALLEGSPVCIKIIDLDSRLLYMSAAGQRQLKIADITAFYGRAYPLDFYPESIRSPLIEHLERAKSGEISSLELPALDSEGGEVWYHTTFVPARDDEGRIEYIIASSVDITERKRVENAVRESEARFRQLAENISQVFRLTDWKNKELLYVSPTYEQVYGRSCRSLHENRMSWLESVHPDDRKRVAGAFCKGAEEGRYVEEEYRIVGGAGETRWVLDRAFPIFDGEGVVDRVAGLAEDITERKNMESAVRDREAELAHVARLSTLGEMATGLAHELNQPLAAIASFAAAGERDIRNGSASLERTRRRLTDICEQVDRAGQIIRGLRTLVRGRHSERSPLLIEECAEEVLQLVQPELRKNGIRVRIAASSSLPRIEADGIQIQQVLLNLIRNAMDAMKDTKLEERSIEIRLGVREEDDELEVLVRDNGHGVSPEHLDKLFEPFFSTKEAGLGMGLSISRSIVQAHGGRLSAENNPDRGVTFRIRFPIHASTPV